MTTTALNIRQIGDPVLHAVPARADFGDPDPIRDYAAQLEHCERSGGGVGVACNQCAAIATPLAMILVGTSDAATREAAQRRYPGDTIPAATLMINPEILAYSPETYYPGHGEGCLSVAGPIRGKVRRHRSVRLRYQTLDGAVIERECSGFEAHIVQHEYDHLQGRVFFQLILADCSTEQKAVLQELLQAERLRRDLGGARDEVGDSLMVFDRDGEAVVFERGHLALALTRIPAATLDGMVSVVQEGRSSR
ncbi:peptide deformylase [Paludibacterium yongneupense]|uniref:peptide deformylase n=1 Tax=Paludibacterium yongneupense TaxID=400061 RepID=UPI000686EFFC|nr:peptide deformylase [Paludibacterium yongneupense]